MKCRPLGLQDMIDLASWSSRQANIRKLQPLELEKYGSEIEACLGIEYPRAPVHRYGKLSDEWRAYLEHELGGAAGSLPLCEALFYRAHNHATRREFRAASQCLRRLAGELGAFSRSDMDLFIAGKRMLSEGIWNFKSFMRGMVGSNELESYEVSLLLSPAEVPARMTRRMWGEGVALIYASAEGLSGAKRERVITEIRVRVLANSPLNAVNNAEEIARAVLSAFRAQFYIRTNLVGAIRTRTMPAGPDSDPSMEAKADWSYFAYRRPFWSARGANTRRPPVLLVKPPQTQAFESDRAYEGWEAMRFQVSQALAVWHEDVHTSASMIWQGLEAVARGVGPRKGHAMAFVEALYEPYYEKVVIGELFDNLRHKLNNQAAIFRRSGIRCNWKIPRCENPLAWAKAVSELGASDIRKEQHWSAPERPRIYFDREIGIFSIARNFQNELPFDARAHFVANLRYLYAIRNALVHSGRRIMSARAANFLAGFGLEMLTFTGYGMSQESAASH